MLLRRYFALCALSALMLGSATGCEALNQKLNSGPGPSTDHYNFSVQDPIPEDGWNTTDESLDELGCYCKR